MPVDPNDFRKAAGHFATGITVVTTYAGGTHFGMTANSFTSVSLEPVLVLVSVDRRARFHDSVLAAGAFAVNVLAADQEDASRWYATRGRPAEPPPDIPHRISPVTGGVLLDDCLATVECANWAVYDGGDHSLVLGEVLALDLTRPGADPLLFFDGAYRRLAPPASP